MPHLKYQLQKRFTRLISKHYRGFGIDSPYVYYLVREVIEAKMHYYPFKKLDRQCERLSAILKQKALTEKSDKSLWLWYKLEYRHLQSSTKLNRLLFRLTNFVNPDKMAFVGNDSGLNLAYLAKVDTRRQVDYWGGDIAIQDFVNTVLDENAVKNVNVSTSNSRLGYDLVQISRSVEHKVLKDFECNLNTYLSEACFLIIENINKDEDIKRFWRRLKKMDRFNISLDLFDIGVLISKKDEPHQDYILSSRAYK